KEKYRLYIFTDIGSGQMKDLKGLLDLNKKIIIIDHHPPKEEFSHPYLVHINPHYFDIDGGQDISASTLNYIFAKQFNVGGIDHLAVIGSLGDNQESSKGFSGVNKHIIEKLSDVDVGKGLRLFGRISKPLYRALAHCTDPFIPEVSGDEGLAIQFLSEMGIDLKDGDNWRALNDLSEEEEKMLTTNIIMKRMNIEENPEDVFGAVYNLKGMKDELQDAREFATILNSCGRQGRQSIGLMLAMGEQNDALEAARKIILSYRRKIVKAFKWFDENKDDDSKIHSTDSTMYLLAKNEIDDTMIGTICSMLSSSKTMDKKYIVGFADSDNGVKVSIRANAFAKNNGIVDQIISKISEKLDVADSGGHAKAGGAKIPNGSEEEFIKAFEENITLINSKKIEENTD
ncbi:MAG TPA: DHH family phosphoesterase, partial [Candidatus Woesearchaeota archaeon]|nr:DHH family phosphoesterase [Candidatus Woesearchaeota archaeon]